MANKPKQNYSVKDGDASERDCFETPRYATELLLPYIPIQVRAVWECAAGSGRIARVLREHYHVVSTDLKTGQDFLSCDAKRFVSASWAIITNPPFSKKYEFAQECIDMARYWALLVPFEACLKMCDLIRAGVQFILPNRRIDFLTPNLLDRISIGESMSYKRLEDVPVKMIRKYSAAQMHTAWMCYGFNLSRDITVVELSTEDKNRIFW